MLTPRLPRYILRGGVVDLGLQELQLSDFEAVIEQRPRDDQLLPHAILSLSILFFGQQHQNAAIRARGHYMHGQTLALLNKALYKPKCYLRDDVLIAVVTLALLEAFVPSGKGVYLKHVAGLEKLLDLRGPKHFCTAKGYEMFQSFRRMILLASLQTRKTSILEQESWKAVQWTYSSAEEKDQQLLLNALADCISLRAKCDDLQSSFTVGTNEYEQRQSQICRKAIDLLRSLHDWEMQWDGARYPSDITALAAAEKVLCNGDYSCLPFRTVISFQTTSVAAIYILYRAVLIRVLQMLAFVSSPELITSSQHSSTGVSTVVSGTAPGLPRAEVLSRCRYSAAAHSAALEISRCLPYFLARKSGLKPSASIIGSISVQTAWIVLGRLESKEGRWMRDLWEQSERGDNIFTRDTWRA